MWDNETDAHTQHIDTGALQVKGLAQRHLSGGKGGYLSCSPPRFILVFEPVTLWSQAHLSNV